MKKKQTKKTTQEKSVTLGDLLDTALVDELKNRKKEMEKEAEERKRAEEERKREERRQREKNKSFEELLNESDFDWRDFK